MFTASGGFPPIESARLTGRLKQEPYFDVSQTYRRFGFQVGKTRFFVFEDQLGVELAFVAEMLERCLAALDRGDAAEYRKLEREIRRFWSVHLGKWLRGYARLVQRASEHSFYRQMARLLESFASEEIVLLGLRIEDEDQARAVVPKSEIQVAFNPDEPVCGACSSGPQSVLARLEGAHAA
jgi:TorA maturation chaperone TorD